MDEDPVQIGFVHVFFVRVFACVCVCGSFLFPFPVPTNPEPLPPEHIFEDKNCPRRFTAARFQTVCLYAQEWDQAVYNEVMFFPSHGSYENPHVSTRVMDIYKFMNSKTLFKFARHDPRVMGSLKPVMVHVNYHPDKWERMLSIVDRFQKGKINALDRFPDGSCKNAPNC